MLFNSLPFVCYLVCTLLLYYLIPKKAQWGFLLAASYVFYAIADPRYLIFILTTTVSVWFTALQVEKINAGQKLYLKEHKKELTKQDKQEYKDRMKRKRWKWLLLCLLFNLGILSVTKYTNFVISTFNSLLNGAMTLQPVDMIVPLGISGLPFSSRSSRNWRRVRSAGTVIFPLRCLRNTVLNARRSFTV